jgi:hypothetical protein
LLFGRVGGRPDIYLLDYYGVFLLC